MKTNRKMNYEFGPAHFSQWATQLIRAKNPGALISPVRTWSLGMRRDGALSALCDHGFIAEAAAAWGALAGIPEGHEFAVVARTYCSAEQIDNPPEGLRCHRLPPETMGSDDAGTAIAIVIEKLTPAAFEFIAMFDDLPACLLSYVLPEPICNAGCLLLLPVNGYELRVRFISIEALDRAGIECRPWLLT
jgi:hypothetical protein